MAHAHENGEKIEGGEKVMHISFTENEEKLLQSRNIRFHSGEYSEDGAFSLLDAVHEAEIFFAQSNDRNSRLLAADCAHLADKIQNAIPDS